VQRLRKYRLGIWLGVIAVAFCAWLPGHFAGHIAHAALDAIAALDGSQADAPPLGHAHHPAGHDEHHGGACPICAAAAASAAPAAAMLPVLAALSMPPSVAAPGGFVQAHTPLTATSLAPYAPRGPPRAA
jgi:hypothetical protein